MLAPLNHLPELQLPGQGRPSHGRSDPAAESPRLSGAVARTYARNGGVVSAEEVALLMRRHCEQPVSQLARWIVDSKVVHFTEQSQTWVPLFQFYLDDMSIRPAVIALLGELGAVMESDDLAAWFVAPNVWLSGAAPIDTMEADFPAVLEAARADRFVMAG